MVNKPDSTIFAENMAENAFNRLQDVLDLRRRRERYIVDFMKDLNKHLVQNVTWDMDKGKIVGADKGKITIYGPEEDNRVLLEFNVFSRRECWMDDGEVKEALFGLGDFVEMENHRETLKEWFGE